MVHSILLFSATTISLNSNQRRRAVDNSLADRHRCRLGPYPTTPQSTRLVYSSLGSANLIGASHLFSN